VPAIAKELNVIASRSKGTIKPVLEFFSQGVNVFAIL
jgi:hypothetical protein